MIIRTQSHARAGLVGNPSDGYFGKTISFIVRNYTANVELWETPEIEILPAARDHSVFQNMEALRRDVAYFGYYGGIRLLKATVKRFSDHCRENGVTLADRNFTLRYSSDVPPQVGMAGSSAIITAALRALMAFYEVKIPRAIQAKLILSVENDELNIPAGLQDRVIQAYEGVVFMNFDRETMDRQGFGDYEELDPALLPPLYIAYSTRLSEGTEVFHNDIRSRFNRGEREVVDAMQTWAGLAQRTRDLLVAGRGGEIGPLLDANFDLRRKLYRVSDGNLRMVETARRCGATAKFTGSGGAIVGTCDDEPMFRRLVESLEPLGMKVIKPLIAAGREAAD
ncbi:MAG: GHMP kinase [Verrucomicrobiae bacterium]|nr:GHMP kinase [Verrucomicrobiae bacterium]MCP5538621.1 GHMP kinase [Akkermansiaceae bacterium]MCP5550916.1 GHMP kinase [Akkermansiaceae bacterium]